MNGATITVKEAATRLDVSEQRIRHLIANGNILAERHGHVWAVDPASVDDYRRRRRPTAGRGLSARMTWAALLSELGRELDNDVAEIFALRPAERSRLSRLHDRHPSEWRWLAHRRADTRHFDTFDAYTEKISQMENVVRTGLIAVKDHGVGLAAHTSTVDVYVDVGTAADLTKTMRLKPTAAGNLTLRTITGLAPHLAAFVLDRDVMPRSVVGIDLLDDPDVRTRRAGAELVQDVLDGR